MAITGTRHRLNGGWILEYPGSNQKELKRDREGDQGSQKTRAGFRRKKQPAQDKQGASTCMDNFTTETAADPALMRKKIDQPQPCQSQDKCNDKSEQATGEQFLPGFTNYSRGR